MMSCKRHIKILKCNLMLFGQAPLINQVIRKLPKPLQAKDMKDVIILILMLFVLKANTLMLIKCL
jgi:patatin-like phospholipase/acyl hydrolase